MECPIVILAEHFDGKLSTATLQLIAQGRQLADQIESELGVVVVGSELETLVKGLETTGPDRIFFVDEPELRHYNPEIYTHVTCQVLEKVRPQMVLLGHTFIGMELGPAIAVRTGFKLVSNCTGVELTKHSLIVTRPLYRGIVNIKIEFDLRTQLILSLQESELPTQSPTERKVVIQKLTAPLGSYGTEIVGFITPDAGEVDITEAKVIVAVGRGIQEKKNIAMAEALANALGGVLGCSRPLTDLGWLPPEHQVGMSGKVVKPKVYIACGISGASHHIVGMKNSALIIAINTDPNAPIFNIAHYGVQGDLGQILPELVARASDAFK